VAVGAGAGAVVVVGDRRGAVELADEVVCGLEVVGVGRSRGRRATGVAGRTGVEEAVAEDALWVVAEGELAVDAEDELGVVPRMVADVDELPQPTGIAAQTANPAANRARARDVADGRPINAPGCA
jgi:hypothetical protein